jgi:hypothetical protein
MVGTLPAQTTQALLRWTAAWLRPAELELGSLVDRECVAYERSCVVQDDPGEVVRHAAPLDGHARAKLLEQRIARLQADPSAVAARERRIATLLPGAANAVAAR